LASFYCHFLSKQEQIVAKLTRAILKQLVGKRGISNVLRQAFQEWGAEFGGRKPRLSDLIGWLRIAIFFAAQGLHLF